MSWNVRGAGRKPILPYIRDMVSIHDMAILVLLESKICEPRASGIISKLSQLYQANQLKFGNGYSGDIWVFWDPARVALSLLDDSHQHMTFQAIPALEQGPPFFFTAVYASPNHHLRKTLWTKLKTSKNGCITSREPWLLMGDFNVILGPHEKQGGRQGTGWSTGTELQDLLDSSDARDVGFVGNPYTRSNHQSPPNRILERLDRCLGNAEWICSYDDIVVRHLPRIGSDHCPLLLTHNKPDHK